MSGPEEMDAHREYFDNQPEDLDDGDVDQALESDLVDIAQARMMSWAMEKVL